MLFIFFWFKICEPLGKNPVGRHALGGDIGGLRFDFGYPKMKKKREKVHCVQGANPVLSQGEGPPRGNPRKFFTAHLRGCYLRNA